MKQKLAILLSFLLISSTLFAQCFEEGWSHPQIQGNTLRCVHALGAVAYTGGDVGTVLKTIDGGVTWFNVNINTPYRILGIYFTDPNTGYATSRQGVHKTIDGGLSWQFTQLSNSSWMYDVEFVTDSIGIICGQNGLIYRTTDAGNTWGNQHSWSSRSLFALHFPDPLNGYAVGGANSTSVGGKVLKTTDGGITWSNFTPLNQKINDVYFTSAQKGFCVTDFGRLVTTIDGGTNWTVTNLSNQQLLGVQFATPNSGIIVGTAADPWITSDGGATWTQVQIPRYAGAIWALSTPSMGQHILVGEAGQIITGSNLLSAAQLRTTAATGNTIYDIIFKNELSGIACGVGGVVMNTSNGGGSWHRDSNFVFGQNYLALAKVSPQIAFMSGSGGQLWKTMDWGVSWTKLTIGVTNQLNDLSFISQDTGWVAGSNGLLLRTLDSGNTWTVMPTGTTTQLNAVHFKSNGVGWIVGDNGQVHKSIDFGVTWQSAYFGNSSTKQEIVFFNDSIGYAGGSTARIYYTHNGGATWLSGPIANGSGVRSILPLSAAKAIGVGGFGNHYMTVDTGKTWSELPLITGNLLYSIYAQDTTLWVTGGNGTILKSGFAGTIQAQYALQICQGDSIQIGGNWITTPGIYKDTLTGICDTLREITVQVRQGSQSMEHVNLCFGDSILLGGAFQTTAGTYLDTLSNVWGCDSVRTTTVQVFPPSTFTYADTICYGDTIIFFNQILTTSGSYQDNSLSSSNGCDSLVTLNLTVYSGSTGVDAQAACDSYTWIDGITYTASNNVATWILTNTSGCDSVVTLDLTISNASTGVDAQAACDSYIWIDGITYTASNNVATWTLVNTSGCDSVVTLDLTINNSSTGMDVQTACDSYSWIDGITYTVSNNVATWTLVNGSGCDSVVTLDLTITTIDSTVTQSGNTLIANEANAAYQWLDCDNNFSIIPGATNQSYTALMNGDYAVQITQNGCVETTACYLITAVAAVNSDFENELLLYENPTDGDFSIDLGNNYPLVSVTIYDISGKLIQSKNFKDSQLLRLKLKAPARIYLVAIEAEGKKAFLRLVKE